MPAAAVIPAPGAYFKIVAVKKLVVGFLWGQVWGCGWGFSLLITPSHSTFGTGRLRPAGPTIL